MSVTGGMRRNLKKNDSKIQNELSHIIEKYNEETFGTQLKRRENILIQSKVFEKATNITGDSIESMDIEKEAKHKKREFLEIEIGLP